MSTRPSCNPKKSEFIPKRCLLEKAAFWLWVVSGGWFFFNAVMVYGFWAGNREYRLESAFIVFFLASIWRSCFIPKPRPGEPIPESPSVRWLLVALPVLLWSALYLPLMQLPFLSDDYVFISRLLTPAGILAPGQFFRPLFHAVFFGLGKLTGFDPGWFHLLGFLLHIGCSLLVFQLGRRICSDFRSAYFIFIIFLLNPLQSEAVVWVSGLQELLWVFFALLGLQFLTSRRTLTWPAVFAASLCWAAALLSKETAVCLLIVIPLCDHAIYGFSRGVRQKTAYMFLGLLVMLYLVLRQNVATVPAEFLAFPNLYMAKNFFITPFRLFSFPWNQAVLEPLAIIKMVLVVTITVIVFPPFLRVQSQRRTALGIALIFAGILPVYRMLHITADLQNSRYLYFSALGWGIVLAGSGLAGMLKTKKVAAMVFITIMMAAQAVCLHINLQPWKRAGEYVAGVISGRIVPDPQKPLDNIHGAYVFRNGYPEFVWMRTDKVPLGKNFVVENHH